MHINRLLSLLLAGAVVLSLAACVSPAAGTAAARAPTSSSQREQPLLPADDPLTPETAAATTYPVIVTDQAGRKVTVSSEPRRLVSSYYISTSMLIALGLQDRVVGVENQPEKRPIYALSAPEFLELASIGTAKEIDLEACAALKPDLVVLPLKLLDSAESLEALGLTVLYVNPENQQLLEEALTLLGVATNTQARAAELIAFSDAQADRLADVLAGVAKPKVYLGGNSDFLNTAGAAMYQSDLITMAGGINVAAEITDTYWAQTSYEQVLAWDPEYIILASDATYTVDDVLADPNLEGCTAIETGHVYQIPGNAEAWDSPVPGGILGAVWLAGILHPEQCPADETAEVIDEFYQTFYGFTYSEIA